MRLTRFADLGLRACMRMAGQPVCFFSTADLAGAFGISRHHLTEAVTALAAAGIVRVWRGAGGGAVLTRPADRLCVGEITHVLEQRSLPAAPVWQLKDMFAVAKSAFINHLNQFTLADCALPCAGSLRDAKHG